MENHTKYGAAIYARAADTLWVNLFIPSELTWAERGVRVRQATKFPETEATDLTLSVKRPVRFTLKLRAPAWLAAPLTLTVNGRETPTTVVDGYASVTREWQDGDRLHLRLRMALWTEPLPQATNLCAVLYGPMVLAAELGRDGLQQLNLYQTGHNENAYRNLSLPAVKYLVADGRRVLPRIEPVAGQPLTFRTRHLAQPQDVTLSPFWRLHDQRYTVYFETFTPAEWARKQAALAAEETARRAFEARIVDDVKTGEQQSETDHTFRGERSSSGGSSPKWRDARDGGWFEYTVKVAPDRAMELRVAYWGSDGGNRAFDLLADGRPFATEKLTAAKPNEFLEKSYPIPVALTQGKPQVVLRFQPKPGNTAGGIFGLRLLLAEPPTKP